MLRQVSYRTCTSFPSGVNKPAPIEGSVLDDVRGVTLTSPKKDDCFWFGSSFVQLHQRHQDRGCCKD
eukprot:12911850-Prorocentrum_lima.AAC.1